MRWGRKEPRGRHGLGAAVTAIPTAPTRPVDVPILADQPWSERYAPPADLEPVAVTPPPLPALPVTPVPVQPAAVAPDPVVDVPPQPVPAAQPLPVLDLPVQASSVEALHRPPVQAPVPVGPRVELGFTDGTFSMLDPASAAAQELSDLVAELLGNDAHAGPTAP